MSSRHRRPGGGYRANSPGKACQPDSYDLFEEEGPQQRPPSVVSDIIGELCPVRTHADVLNFVKSKVEDLKRSVSNKARHVAASYTTEDFIQEGYYFACKALEISLTNDIPFEGVFWRLFTQGVNKMAFGSVFAKSMFDNDGNDAPDTKESWAQAAGGNLDQDEFIVEACNREVMEEAIALMSPPQQEVARLLVFDRMSTYEAAEHLGKSRTVVQKLWKSGLRMVQRQQARKDNPPNKRFLGTGGQTGNFTLP